jgi:pyrroline-5-carboxylate reductase
MALNRYDRNAITGKQSFMMQIVKNSSRIGFVGAGQMARALAKGLGQLLTKFDAAPIAYDPVDAAFTDFLETAPGATRAKNNRDVAQQASIIVLATKPQQLQAACEDLKAALKPEHLIISIAAGVTLDSLTKWTGAARIIRVMPNTPCLVSAGAAVFSASAGATQEDRQFVMDWFSTVGFAAEAPEKLLDAVTGLSGSGPGYAFTIIEAMADGGVLSGLPRELSLKLAAQTFLGAAKMVLETGEHPAQLRDRVASPGGTTIAGLKQLEAGGVRDALMSAVKAATERAKELGG